MINSKKKVEKVYNPMFESTQISDLFLCDYLPELDPVCVKIYVYCVYLSKTGQDITEDSISKTLGIEKSIFLEKLIELEKNGCMSIQGGALALTDINQKELNRFYRKITCVRPDDICTEESNENQERNQVCKLISDRFFGGLMPGSWYGDIELWFSQYKFSTDVMYMLFQHCQNNRIMTKPYVRKVASEWAKNNIHTVSELEVYLCEYEKLKDIFKAIKKKLRLNRNLTEYEEDIVSKWFFIYKYDFKIIETALKKSTGRANFSIATFDAIISDWFKNGLNDIEYIMNYEEERRKKYAASKNNKIADAVPQKKNYEERKYNDEFFDSLYGQEDK